MPLLQSASYEQVVELSRRGRSCLDFSSAPPDPMYHIPNSCGNDQDPNSYLCEHDRSWLRLDPTKTNRTDWRKES